MDAGMKAERLAKDTSSSLQRIFWFLEDVVQVGPKRAVHRLRAFDAIQAGGAFDPLFYARQSAVGKLGAAQLLRHYITTGYADGLDPSETFSTAKYIDFYPDVRRAGGDPLSHYLMHGAAEHRISLPSIHADPRLQILSSVPMEDNGQVDWPAQAAGAMPQKAYDVRVDDAVPAEGRRGDAFLARFTLLSATPDWAGAVAALNAMTIEGRVLTGDDDAPDVSIVIPVYGQLAYTLNCLHALLQQRSRYSFEIIVGDDLSPDDSGTWLPRLGFIRYVRHGQNNGFIGNVNLTAGHARGATFVLLNNDTRVVEGWLDGLIDGFRLFPKAGLIGSKIFYPDGTLQEAGGIVWQDGSAWNFGRDDDPNRPRYAYARQVDYVSGCAIAIPAAVWRELEGFDAHFSPAYYEDVDLCLRLQARGYETWFQPQSRLIHYEGKTSGTDISGGIKAFQQVNQAKLRARWQDVLSTHRPNGREPWLERERKIKHRVLVIDAANPTPWQDAGSVAVINLFRYYMALGYGVSFVAENFLYERRAVSEMQAMGVQVFYAPYEAFLPGLLKHYGMLFDVIHVIRAEVAYKSLDLIRALAPGALAIYQNCDLEYLRLERQAGVERRPDLLAEAQALKPRELGLSRQYDLTISHSEAEKAILNEELPGETVIVMPLIEESRRVSPGLQGRKNFMFLGGYGHPPNVDAALWLLDEIWPDLSARYPEAKLVLVGASPPPAIRDREGPRVVVTGLVDDLAPWFAEARVFLAALRYGAGSKGKVLASLAHGVPVVATDIAAEGLPIEDGKTLVLANTADEMIREASRVYDMDEADWIVRSKAGQAYITAHHSFAAGVRLLDQALDLAREKAAEGGQPQRSRVS
jgi:GT2 family glycosyltransferase